MLASSIHQLRLMGDVTGFGGFVCDQTETLNVSCWGFVLLAPWTSVQHVTTWTKVQLKPKNDPHFGFCHFSTVLHLFQCYLGRTTSLPVMVEPVLIWMMSFFLTAQNVFSSNQEAKPCESRSRGSTNWESSLLPVSDPNRRFHCRLRVKVDGGEGTLPITARSANQKWDGVTSGRVLVTKSCTDKMAKWDCDASAGTKSAYF